MKLIFLDIDGVMNNWIESQPSNKHESLEFASSCVENLKYILKETNARIVVSSTWRIGETEKTLKDKVFKHYDLEKYILDVTPVCWEEPRGVEIASYLASLHICNVEGIVILDDDSDMEDLKDYLVRTDPKYGLTKKDAELAIQILIK
ncbi:hypothetical protein AF332_11640 [Sporosarcina globispora]|uniref:FCP1 homology domain-containing protein n=1 Tax=Sporosarcina globispora TaxID=1459 RepID=A0A0M0GC32_SPOGL|nr:HAD domain-containing protein [Sporosarcina globispora]KON87414.1 hypothetical protein AF332_11640 [Sporosarcina globispora]